MNYKFPKINTLDDVLPHIKDRPEFIVADRDVGTIINYAVAFADTFQMTGPDDLGGAIRRECRGLIFGVDGTIISRPFHKFFNISEREETQLNALDFEQSHIILDKLDGSMCRPVLDMEAQLAVREDPSAGPVNIQLGTKMGITDVAIQAKSHLTYGQKQWLATMFLAGFTPILEYVSPTNKIVLHYDEPQLILTAIRDTVTGQYLSLGTIVDAPFPIVTSFGKLQGNIESYVEGVRSAVGREGDIIRFTTGHMVKLKADEYVRIHKVKDIIRSDKNIAEIIINNNLDDILPILDSQDLDRVREYEKNFQSMLSDVRSRIEGLILLARTVYGGDRKRIALEMVPNLVHKEDAAFIFAFFGGRNVNELITEKIKRDVGNTTRYNAMLTWMDNKVLEKV